MKTNHEQAVICLRGLGYDMPAIRRALLKLAGKTEPELADRCGVTRPTVAAQIAGVRHNLRVQALISQELGVRPEVLFDQWAELSKETGAVLRPVAARCESECAA